MVSFLGVLSQNRASMSQMIGGYLPSTIKHPGRPLRAPRLLFNHRVASKPASPGPTGAEAGGRGCAELGTEPAPLLKPSSHL